ncbi:MAG: hypothetical protein GF344_04630 [Chitinivibrionales bacterium]|nr:hypothetical protein [Chitinivibrionales bacterium]MBD3356308.1 hypothetical protein [Chitinivibrionales bacterium]
MRRVFIIAASALLVLIVVFAIGYSLGRGANLSTVTIQNRASNAIAAARVEYGHGMVSVTSIEKRDEKNAVFYLRRPTDYRVIVTFEDGRTIRSDERQVEPKGAVTEIVTDSVIVRAY